MSYNTALLFVSSLVSPELLIAIFWNQECTYLSGHNYHNRTDDKVKSCNKESGHFTEKRDVAIEEHVDVASTLLISGFHFHFTCYILYKRLDA